MFTFKVDERIELQLLERKDAKPLYALIDRQRAYLREWLPWVDKATSVEGYFSIIDSWLQQFVANNGFQAGILYEKQLVGMIGFHMLDWVNRKTSIGYWLSKDHQGKGIMTKACQAIIDYAFETWDMNRIEIRAAAENKKSQAVPIRLGFTYEGSQRDGEYLYDKFVDHAIYGLLKKEWRKRKSVNVQR